MIGCCLRCRPVCRLERNVAGLKKYAPEVDSAIFQVCSAIDRSLLNSFCRTVRSKLFLSTTAAVHSGRDDSIRSKTRLLLRVARRKCVAVFGGAGVYATLFSVCFMLASEQLPRFQSASASLAQHVVGMWVTVNLVTSTVYYTLRRRPLR